MSCRGCVDTIPYTHTLMNRSCLRSGTNQIYTSPTGRLVVKISYPSPCCLLRMVTVLHNSRSHYSSGSAEVWLACRRPFYHSHRETPNMKHLAWSLWTGNPPHIMKRGEEPSSNRNLPFLSGRHSEGLLVSRLSHI